MHRLFFVLLFLFASCAAPARSDGGATAWARSFRSDGSGHGVAFGDDLILVDSAASSAETVAPHTAGGRGCFVARIGRDGEARWVTSLRAALGVDCLDVATRADRDIYVLTTNPRSAGAPRGLVRLDATGTVVAQHSFPLGVHPMRVVVSPRGSVAISGALASGAWFVTLLDQDGAHRATATLPASCAVPLVFASDGALFGVGSFPAHARCRFGEATLSAVHGQGSALMIRFDEDLTPRFARTTATLADVIVRSLVADASGGVWFTATARGSVDFGGGPIGSPAARNLFAVHVDEAGNHLASRAYPRGGLASVVLSPNGDLYFVGDSSADADYGGDPLPAGMLLARTTIAGDHVWSRSMRGGVVSSHAVVNARGELYVVGRVAARPLALGDGVTIDGVGAARFYARFDP